MIELFDELDELTREPFLSGQGRDRRPAGEDTASRPASIGPGTIHDPFFQESPAVFEADLDAAYKRPTSSSSAASSTPASACRSTT